MTLNFKERFMELEKVDIFLVKTCDYSYEQHIQNVEKEILKLEPEYYFLENYTESNSFVTRIVVFQER